MENRYPLLEELQLRDVEQLPGSPLHDYLWQAREVFGETEPKRTVKIIFAAPTSRQVQSKGTPDTVLFYLN